MHFKVNHHTYYTYSKMVYLEPHILCVHPPTYPYQTISNFTLKINPEPVVFSRSNDIEGNSIYLACFQDLTDHLLIETEFEVQTFRSNPFDYVLYPFETCNLPFHYPVELHPLLKPYLKPDNRNSKIENFALECVGKSQQSTLRLLMYLTETINQDFVYEFNEFGSPRSSDETLRLKKGSCRDLAVLMIDVCRVLGIAARFASGYYLGNGTDESYLHAWVEVYLPGAGWRGYDPTEGLVVADQHILLASSAYPSLIAPVQGVFRGDARALLRNKVSIQPVI
ncbi:transglutaminase family protein [Cytophagaceae bacterium DM2B3-1]|uniref:Transglutaminase family protein n=1 Tax=Xanthocytophaga flava TaxID=3048013 RepID=A0ABT7CVJ4_9BACT|nr:transglutaminase family protein [Xanthocytophaga flavus]MDJ1472485.1 transglutaminase family protein [Xanthocytophaga flavus]MDJ1497793.1 transglutaminase family protein [Xanthocytophaga flavus]